MATTGAVTRSPLNEQIAAYIRDRILSGELPPGTRMVQADWGERLGTSRMPVRDAFLRLQSEGMLTPTENGVSRVAPLSEQDIRDGYELNAFAAGLATKRAALRLTQEALSEITRAHEVYVDAVEREDVEAAYTANHDFHRLINLHSESPRLIAMLRVLSAGLPQVGTKSIPAWRARNIDAHAEILAALRDHDGDRASSLMQEHIFEAADLAIDYLRMRGFWNAVDPGESSAM